MADWNWLLERNCSHVLLFTVSIDLQKKPSAVIWHRWVFSGRSIKENQFWVNSFLAWIIFPCQYVVQHLFVLWNFVPYNPRLSIYRNPEAWWAESCTYRMILIFWHFSNIVVLGVTVLHSKQPRVTSTLLRKKCVPWWNLLLEEGRKISRWELQWSRWQQQRGTIDCFRDQIHQCPVLEPHMPCTPHQGPRKTKQLKISNKIIWITKKNATK